jgi:hypothetical protein
MIGLKSSPGNINFETTFFCWTDFNARIIQPVVLGRKFDGDNVFFRPLGLYPRT